MVIVEVGEVYLGRLVNQVREESRVTAGEMDYKERGVIPALGDLRAILVKMVNQDPKVTLAREATVLKFGVGYYLVNFGPANVRSDPSQTKTPPLPQDPKASLANPAGPVPKASANPASTASMEPQAAEAQLVSKEQLASKVHLGIATLMTVKLQTLGVLSWLNIRGLICRLKVIQKVERRKSRLKSQLISG